MGEKHHQNYVITFIFKNLHYKPERKYLLISPVVNILFPTIQEYKNDTQKRGNRLLKRQEQKFLFLGEKSSKFLLINQHLHCLFSPIPVQMMYLSVT